MLLGRYQSSSFPAFCERIAKANLVFEGVDVVYHSPSQGKLAFGWTGPLRQDGQTITLGDYPRYRNPYTETDFGSDPVEVRLHPHHLSLDWRSLMRNFT